MSIIPAYLSSFSSIPTLQRSVAERFGIDRSEQPEENVNVDPARQKNFENSNRTERSHDSLLIKSGDVASSYGDVLSLSSAKEDTTKTVSASVTGEEKAESKNADHTTQPLKDKKDGAKELSDEEKQQVAELKQRDAEVKAHEAAHLAAAGGLARGGASYEYQKGPDGNAYAVGGEVSIDTATVKGDAEATIAKAQQVRSAALAPANPSSQDYKVAAAASQMEAQARQELAKQQQVSQNDNVSQDAEASEENENQKTGEMVQPVSQKAVAKYAAQSLNASRQMATGFRAMA